LSRQRGIGENTFYHEGAKFAKNGKKFFFVVFVLFVVKNAPQQVFDSDRFRVIPTDSDQKKKKSATD
jgi:hypothetical protein